jgi:hypothetical protein
MSCARSPKLSPEFETSARETARLDAWEELRERSQRESGGIAALVPGISAMYRPEDFEPPPGFKSDRVEREQARLLAKA